MWSFDLFSGKKKTNKPVGNNYHTKLEVQVQHEKGLLIPTNLSVVSAEDKELLRIFKSTLETIVNESYYRIEPEGVHIDWESYYKIKADEDISFIFNWLKIPTQSAIIPVLTHDGAFSDKSFRINIHHWLEEGHLIHIKSSSLPLVEYTHNGTVQEFLLTDKVYQLSQLIRTINTQALNQEEHEKIWATIRGLYDQGFCELDSVYLQNTIILTPDNFYIDYESVDINGDEVVTVSPMFEGAPDKWLSSFDSSNSVQAKYDVIVDDSRIRVYVSDEVAVILNTFKSFPGRRLAGKTAQRFLDNPKPFFNEVSEHIVDFEKSKKKADKKRITPLSFSFEVNSTEQQQIHSVKIILSYFDSMGIYHPIYKPLNTTDELNNFIVSYDRAMSGDRPYFNYFSERLRIDDNVSKVRLEKLKEVYRRWIIIENPMIDLDQLLDITLYGKRIESIGVEQEVYVPVLYCEDKENQWYDKDDSIKLIKISLPNEKEDIYIPINEDWLENFHIAIQIAERNNKSLLTYRDLLSEIKVKDAKNLLDALRTETSSKSVSKPVKKPKNESIKINLKTNFSNLDYQETIKLNHDFYQILESQPDIVIRPTSLRSHINLKTHQNQGVNRLHQLYKHPVTRGLLIADDMGLGKTLQILTFLVKIYEDKDQARPSLVVLPKSLVDNWEEELKKFFDLREDFSLALHGKTLNEYKVSKYQISEEIKEHGILNLLDTSVFEQSKIIITTYDTLLRYEWSFARVDFEVVVCDEVQAIKNPSAQRTLSVKKINANFKIACTGTPVENNLIDLWSLYDFVQPGLLGTLESFHKNYRQPIESGVECSEELVEQLISLIKPQIIRRMKSDIAIDLPKKYFVHNVVPDGTNTFKQRLNKDDLLSITMSDYQINLYNSGLNRLLHNNRDQTPAKFLEVSHYIRAVCAEPYCIPHKPLLLTLDDKAKKTHLENSKKLNWLLDQLHDIKIKKDKVIVFTESRKIQACLSYFIKEEFNIHTQVINGDTNDRQSKIRAFEIVPGFNVIILSPLAAGAGLNIVSANHVIHFTRMWNPAKENQATDRAYRIGQTKDVYVYCPISIMSDTTSFDKRLDELLKEKQGLSDNIIANDSLNMMLKPHNDIKAQQILEAMGVDTKNNDCEIYNVDEMSGVDFEDYCMRILKSKGYECQKTPPSGDGGIDIIAIKEDSTGYLVQVKRAKESSSLGWDAIKEVVGGRRLYETRFSSITFKALVITNATWNSTAIKQANINGVEYWDRADIKEFMKDNG